MGWLPRSREYRRPLVQLSETDEQRKPNGPARDRGDASAASEPRLVPAVCSIRSMAWARRRRPDRTAGHYEPWCPHSATTHRVKVSRQAVGPASKTRLPPRPVGSRAAVSWTISPPALRGAAEASRVAGWIRHACVDDLSAAGRPRKPHHPCRRWSGCPVSVSVSVSAPVAAVAAAADSSDRYPRQWLLRRRSSASRHQEARCVASPPACVSSLRELSIDGKRIVCPVNETASPTATALPADADGLNAKPSSPRGKRCVRGGRPARQPAGRLSARFRSQLIKKTDEHRKPNGPARKKRCDPSSSRALGEPRIACPVEPMGLTQLGAGERAWSSARRPAPCRPSGSPAATKGPIRSRGRPTSGLRPGTSTVSSGFRIGSRASPKPLRRIHWISPIQADTRASSAA